MLRRITLLPVLAIVLAQICHAEDACFEVSLDKANLKSPIPDPKPKDWRLSPLVVPYVRIDGGGEVYVTRITGPEPAWLQQEIPTPRNTLYVRAESGREITGRLFVSNEDATGMVAIPFSIPASAADPKARDAFYRAKAAHYQHLLDENIPGGAWFRFQRDQALAELAQKPRPERDPLRPSRGDLEDTFGLFSGDRALSENLQLDRALRITGGAGETVPLASMKGIDIQEMDWAKLVKDLRPQLDPLASMIPADQHAIFFPSFDAAVALADEADRDSTPLLDLFTARAEDARVKERYQKQLGLSLSGLGRLLGPALVKSMAITGSDPYWRLGSDVAVIFEPKDAAALRRMLATQIAMSTVGRKDVVAEKGDGPLFSYSLVESPDREICSYLAEIGNAIVVSNSAKQLERIALAAKGRTPSLASQNEYIFFRDRYKRGDADETALVILTDATIRRWCGPKWRIADSRRTRALAAMTAEEARYFDELVQGNAKAREINSGTIDIGPMQLTAAGVTSKMYGSPEFMTPIVELDFDSVTRAEATSYERWRDTYQQNWRQYFDPIAIRLTTNQQKLAADMTVMPLIARTDYAELMQVTRGAKLSDVATDRHDTLVHFAMAINKDAEPMRKLDGELSSFLLKDQNVGLLSWIGKTFCIYVDDDLYWQKLAKAGEDAARLDKQLGGLPVALRVAVENPLKLALFLSAARKWVDGSAPELTSWETLKYNDQSYVKIGPSAKAREDHRQIPDDFVVCYVALPDALVVSLNENVIKHAIDRYQQRKAGKDTLPQAHPWIGSQVALQADAKLPQTLGLLLAPEYRRKMQERAWGNLPILNEWKRLYPKEDPVKLHEKFWQVRLTCPGGGSYVWNERFQTMESTVYGCPAAPKPGPIMPRILNEFRFGNFGMDFERGGLRARAILDRSSAK